jgi:cytochrome c peroxidase
MLLNKGLIHIGLPIPVGAEFTLVKVNDSYGYASAAELSLFRRRLPATNLRFITGVMWDGRESFPGTGTTPILVTAAPEENTAALFNDLKHQANDATLTHAQAASPLTDDQQTAIALFELNLATAQQRVQGAGLLDIREAEGGPAFVAIQPFYVTIDDVLSGDVTGAPFDRNAMTLSQAWRSSPFRERREIARGTKLFGTKQFDITGIGGLNDDLGLPTIRGTCTTCHDTPNIGNHSVALPLDLGLTGASRRTSDMPLYTLQNLQIGTTRTTTDPGRALLVFLDVADGMLTFFSAKVARSLRPGGAHAGLVEGGEPSVRRLAELGLFTIERAFDPATGGQVVMSPRVDALPAAK